MGVKSQSKKKRRERGKKAPVSGLFLRPFLLVATVAVAGLLGSLLVPKQEKPSPPPVLQPDPSSAPGETWDLARVLSLSASELEKTDIAILNLVCAEGFEDFDAAVFHRDFRLLDEWARHVRAEIERTRHRFERNPAEFENSWSYFQALTMVCVIQEDFGIHFNPEQISSYDYSDAKNTILHGLLGKERSGTCANMPVLYVAIGRRLGFPMYLVTVPSHVFARWESSDGKVRFNMEGTNHGLRCPSDAYYTKFPRSFEETQLREAGNLKNLSNRESFGLFMMMRGHILEAQGKLEEAQFAHSISHRYCPENFSTFVWLALSAGKRDLIRAGLINPITRQNSPINAPVPPPQIPEESLRREEIIDRTRE